MFFRHRDYLNFYYKEIVWLPVYPYSHIHEWTYKVRFTLKRNAQNNVLCIYDNINISNYLKLSSSNSETNASGLLRKERLPINDNSVWIMDCMKKVHHYLLFTTWDTFTFFIILFNICNSPNEKTPANLWFVMANEKLCIYQDNWY